KEMVDGNTIIGDPITTPEGTVIIPVSKVHLGFASGGSDFSGKNSEKDRFGGGSGAGLTVDPVAFLILSGGNVRLIQLAEKNNTADRAINLVPEVMDKLTELAGYFAAKKDKDKNADAAGDTGK
ncbi:MAG: GerW family sporulation protein, partial [Acetanaerobacterium sp.]